MQSIASTVQATLESTHPTVAKIELPSQTTEPISQPIITKCQLDASTGKLILWSTSDTMIRMCSLTQMWSKSRNCGRDIALFCLHLYKRLVTSLMYLN